MKMKTARKNMVEVQTGLGLCVFNLRQKSLILSSCAIFKPQTVKSGIAV